MHRGNRPALGFVLAPIGIMLVLPSTLAVLQVFGAEVTRGGAAEAWRYGMFTSIVGIPLAYLAEALFGGWAHRYLAERGRRDLHAYALAGAAIALSPFVFYTLVGLVAGLRYPRLMFNWGSMRFGLLWGAVSVPCGMACAAVFWWIAVRPDEVSHKRCSELDGSNDS